MSPPLADLRLQRAATLLDKIETLWWPEESLRGLILDRDGIPRGVLLDVAPPSHREYWRLAAVPPMAIGEVPLTADTWIGVLTLRGERVDRIFTLVDGAEHAENCEHFAPITEPLPAPWALLLAAELNRAVALWNVTRLPIPPALSTARRNPARFVVRADPCAPFTRRGRTAERCPSRISAHSPRSPSLRSGQSEIARGLRRQ